MVRSDIKKSLPRAKSLFVPVRVIKKLSGIAGVPYDKSKGKCGGLCPGMGTRERIRLMALLGKMVEGTCSGSADSAVERVGLSWMEVVRARKDYEEFGRLWEAAMEVRREVVSARMEEIVWERALNGYDEEKVSVSKDGVERRYVQRVIDPRMALDVLRGLVGVGKRKVGDSVVSGVLGGRISESQVVKPGEAEEAAEAAALEPTRDAECFPDRKSAMAEIMRLGGEG